MRFRIGEEEIEARVEGRQAFTSRHTGANLLRMKIWFLVQGLEYNEKILNMLGGAKQPRITSEVDRPIRWKASNHTWMYRGSEQDEYTVYEHSCDLEEAEELVIEKLIVDDFELEPYRYEEKFTNKGLEIDARVRLAPEQADRLVAHVKDHDYCPVVRKGVSEQTREMSVVAYDWSVHDGYIKQALSLVDRSEEDDRPKSSGATFMMSHLRMTAETASGLDELLSALLDKGILTQEDRDGIKERARKNSWRKHREMNKVKDLDDIADGLF